MPSKMKKANVLFQEDIFNQKRKQRKDVYTQKPIPKTGYVEVSKKPSFNNGGTFKTAAKNAASRKAANTYDLDNDVAPPSSNEINKAGGWSTITSRILTMERRCNEGQLNKVAEKKERLKDQNAWKYFDGYVKVGLVKESNTWKMVARVKYGRSSHYGSDVDLLKRQSDGTWK